MADPRFFTNKGPFKLFELARIGGAELDNEKNADISVKDVASLQDATKETISFLDNKKYKPVFEKTKAGACIIHPKFKDDAPKGVALLLSQNPYKTYALIAQAFYPEDEKSSDVSEKAVIHPTAKIGKDCTIQAGVVIDENVQIGNNVYIQYNSVISKGVTLGKNTNIGANCTLSHCDIGSNVRLFPGVRIGQDGFGFAIDPSGHVSVPQLGRVIVEDFVEIGANATIDRGAGPDTIIGQGARIDNLVQLGHNVKIGRGAVIVAQTGISGSSEIGDFAVLGGQSGVAGHLKVGAGAQVGAQSGISKDVKPGEIVFGTPARPIKEFWKTLAVLNKLVKKGTNA